MLYKTNNPGQFQKLPNTFENEDNEQVVIEPDELLLLVFTGPWSSFTVEHELLRLKTLEIVYMLASEKNDLSMFFTPVSP